jgi:YD repeat-containing protein
VVRTSGDYVNYGYDADGQVVAAKGYEPNGTPRLHEQLDYVYDAAHNLARRTNNGFLESFAVNTLNQLSSNTRSGRLSVAGTTSSAVTNVAVNTLKASLYGDNTFVATNLLLVNGTNTFSAVAKDSYGRVDTGSARVYLPATNHFTYDANGNLISDGAKGFEYDDENELVRVTATNSWKSEFAYDGKMRRRVRDEYIWTNSAWVLATRTHYIYEGKFGDSGAGW